MFIKKIYLEFSSFISDNMRSILKDYKIVSIVFDDK